jgi:hypothetical protein
MLVKVHGLSHQRDAFIEADTLHGPANMQALERCHRPLLVAPAERSNRWDFISAVCGSDTQRIMREGLKEGMGHGPPPVEAWEADVSEFAVAHLRTPAVARDSFVVGGGWLLDDFEGGGDALMLELARRGVIDCFDLGPHHPLIAQVEALTEADFDFYAAIRIVRGRDRRQPQYAYGNVSFRGKPAFSVLELEPSADHVLTGIGNAPLILMMGAFTCTAAVVLDHVRGLPGDEGMTVEQVQLQLAFAYGHDSAAAMMATNQAFGGFACPTTPDAALTRSAEFAPHQLQIVGVTPRVAPLSTVKKMRYRMDWYCQPAIVVPAGAAGAAERFLCKRAAHSVLFVGA